MAGIALAVFMACGVAWAQPSGGGDAALPGGAGPNVALGKAVAYSVAPSLPPDAEGGSKLTDGITLGSGPIAWADEATVGWHYPAYSIASHSGINLVIDLGEEMPLHSSVLRALNASGQMVWWRLPQRVTIAVSRDGQDFYRVQTRNKLLTYGPDADLEGDFFAVEERDRSFFHPLAFDLRGVTARYVALSIKAESFVFWLDEWQVFRMPESAPPAPEREVYTPANRIMLPMAAGTPFTPRDAVYFGPFKDDFVISSTIPAPHYLDLTDYRAEDDRPPLRLVVEVPAEVELLPQPRLTDANMTQEVVEANGDPIRRITFVCDDAGNHPLVSSVAAVWTFNRRVGPLFFAATADLPADAAASFRAESVGQRYTAMTFPIRTVAIPEVPAMDTFHIGLSWMGGQTSAAWPDFLANFRKLGFNSIRVTAGMADGGSGAVAEAHRDYIEAAEAMGMRLTLVHGGTHGLRRYDEDAASQAPDNPFLCPSYDGPAWDALQEEIATAARILQPHNVWWNIEGYAYAYLREDCPRCQAGLAESGLAPLRYYEQQGARILERLREPLDESDRLERVGLYDLWPTAGGRLEAHGMHDAETLNRLGYVWPYHEVFMFEPAYPQALNTAMPHLYCAGLVDVLHTHMARPGARLLEGKWNHVNVLSTGTFGEFPSFKVEQMVYEQVLNEGGIDFYNLENFDTPLDFYYFATALARLAPFEPLFASGRCLVDWGGLNRNLYYTAFANDDEALVLVGNYTSIVPERTRIFTPVGTPCTVTDLISGAAVENLHGTVDLYIDPQDIRLLHVVRAEEADE
jgi:hypothetical protein